MLSTWFWLALVFFGCLVACLEFGYRVGQRRLTPEADELSKSPNLLSGSVYTLLGLLLSFSFSLTVQRFESRRHLVIDEANAIGTAYLRVDLLQPNDQPGMRHEFQRFTDAQIKLGEQLNSGQNISDQIKTTQSAQHRIWELAMTAYESDPHESTRILFTPAINQMFDLASTRIEASETRMPGMIYLLLVLLSFASAVLAGRGLAGRPNREWGHRIVFSAVLALVLFVILDLDDPRQGSIRIDHADQMLQDLRSSMG